MDIASPRFTDYVILPPMAAAQCAMAWVVTRHVQREYPRWAAILVAAGFLLFGCILMAGVGSEYARIARPLANIIGWRAVDRIKTGSFLWCFSSTPAVALYFVVRFIANRVPAAHQPERRKLIVNAGKAVIAAPFLIAAYGTTLGRTMFQVQEVEIPVADLPPDLARLRILHLSDLHLGPFLSEPQLARVIDAANELRPDIAVVTGDLISSVEDPVNLAIKQCARLRADRILGCLGNHERYARIEDYVTRQAALHGIDFLRHGAETLRFGSAGLNFGGVDYQPFGRPDLYLANAGELMRNDAVNILLSHNPDVFPVASAQGWDVTLAGHTHGGQVTVEILNQTLNLARIYTRYVSGYYRLGRSSCYVTRGIGTIGIPARLGAPPEITLIRLVKGTSV